MAETWEKVEVASAMEAVLQELHVLPEDQAIEVIVQALQKRPELAPAVVVASCPDLTYAPAKACTERREVGFIKSFNNQNGYGFISSSEVQDIFGCDAFLHRRQMGSCQVGQQVSFAIMLNEVSKPQAFDLQPVSGSAPGMPPPAPMPGRAPMPAAPSYGHGHGQGYGHGHGYGPGYGHGPPPDRSGFGAEFAGRRFRGVIQSYSPASGFGFIECRETEEIFRKDIYVSREEVRDAQPGSHVTFGLGFNARGLPQAKNLKVLFPPEGGGGGPMSPAGGMSLKRAPDPRARMPAGRYAFSGTQAQVKKPKTEDGEDDVQNLDDMQNLDDVQNPVSEETAETGAEKES